MTAGEQQQIFSRWLKQYQALIFKVVRAYTTEAADRDDLFQEVCLQLWRSVPGFRAESAVSTWIYRVGLRTAMTWQRKEQRERERVNRYVEQELPLLQSTTAEDGRLQWLFQEINKLDKIERSLALLLLDGFSYKEMAEVLGISESNVGVKIYRIKKRLTERAKKMESHGV